jgi:hypothetical protein
MSAPESLQPVRDADGNMKQSMLKVDGKPFRCRCGCNVFHQPDDTQPEIYACNACESWYESE